MFLEILNRTHGCVRVPSRWRLCTSSQPGAFFVSFKRRRLAASSRWPTTTTRSESRVR